MRYNVIPTPHFKKSAKVLLKRFGSLKSELRELETILQENPLHGIPLGNNSFKIRLAIKSKGKGKSGGARVITYVVTKESEIYLLEIYDKSKFSSIDDKIFQKLIAEIVTAKGIK